MIEHLLIGLAAAAQSPQPARADETPIIVTGERISDLRARLAACLARNCPPDEDIDATLALAEGLFVDGEYGEARGLVAASLRRNGDEAKRFPEPVSDLYRVHARLSRSLGFDNAALRSTHGILGALKEGIPTQDHRHFTARFEIAEVQLRMGRLASAKQTLGDLVREARRAGRDDVATQASLRTLWYEWMVTPQSDLERLARGADPTRRYESVGARLILARMLRHEGKTEQADALLAGIGSGNSGIRRLLSAPTYHLLQQETVVPEGSTLNEAVTLGNTLHRVTENYEKKWIDLGFWIGPDGRVSDLEVLRKGGNDAWAAPLIESIGGRLYSAAEAPTYKVERYTMTAGFEPATGTRIARRSPRARVEYVDLTAQNEAGQPASRAVPQPN
jgi:hypothetical protein